MQKQILNPAFARKIPLPEKTSFFLSAIDKSTFGHPVAVMCKEILTKKAGTVLYVGDNAREIVLDKLFIGTINHPNLYFTTRGGHIINARSIAVNPAMIGMAGFSPFLSINFIGSFPAYTYGLWKG